MSNSVGLFGRLIEQWRKKATLFHDASRKANVEGMVELDAYRDGKSVMAKECADELEAALKALPTQTKDSVMAHEDQEQKQRSIEDVLEHLDWEWCEGGGHHFIPQGVLEADLRRWLVQNDMPSDWREFVISAFNEGWAAAKGGEFQSLAEAYEWSHVKIQFGIIDERLATSPHAQAQER